MKYLLLWLAAFALATSVVFAEPAWVDPDIIKAYEKVTGKNYAEEVAKLTPQEEKAPVSGYGNVIIRFNGGDPNNKIYIGQKNRMDILIANDMPLWGMSLGFKFTCLSGTLNWVEGYGSVPEVWPDSAILRRHGDGITGFADNLSLTTAPSDSVLLGGTIDYQRRYPLVASYQPRLVYSMLLDVPAGLTPRSNWFCVDNVRIPPAGDWLFVEDLGGGSTHGYPPLFNGQPNQSEWNPNAPNVYFNLVEPCWQPSSSPKEEGSGELEEKMAVAEEFDYRGVPGITRYDDGLYLTVDIEFERDIPELESIDPRVSIYRIGSKITRSGNRIWVTFPLDLLPRIAKYSGVREMRGLERQSPNLNYSTPIVEGYYAAIDATHHVSGSNVKICPAQNCS